MAEEEVVDTVAPVDTDTATPTEVVADKSILTETPETEVKPYWPEDWQKRMAGEDEKELKHVGKYASPEAVWKKARALEARLSSGELKTALPKDAKPEELTQWRKDNGIPESPDKYDLTGLPITDDTKPLVDEFLKSAHAANMSPEQVKAAIKWQKDSGTSIVAARAEKDEAERVAALDVLNEEWGSGFRRNIQMVEGYLEKFPESVREQLKGGRLADGTGIFNHPDIVRGFVAMALEANPAATLVPSGGGDPAKGIDDQIASHEQFMKEHRSDYNKDEKRQAEYRSLLDARERMKSRKVA